MASIIKKTCCCCQIKQKQCFYTWWSNLVWVKSTDLGILTSDGRKSTGVNNVSPDIVHANSQSHWLGLFIRTQPSLMLLVTNVPLLLWQMSAVKRPIVSFYKSQIKGIFTQWCIHPIWLTVLSGNQWFDVLLNCAQVTSEDMKKCTVHTCTHTCTHSVCLSVSVCTVCSKGRCSRICDPAAFSTFQEYLPQQSRLTSSPLSLSTHTYWTPSWKQL